MAPNATPAAPRPAPVVVDRPTNGQRVTLAAGAAGSGNSSGSSGAMLLVLAGVLFAFLAIGMSRVPLTAVPTMIGSQFERNRQTILLTGLAIGFGCVAVGLFATLGGQ